MKAPDAVRVPATAVVMTRNEAVNLPRCLQALGGFAQVVVVDSHSTDGTAEIARHFGAEVVPFRWNGGYPKKKQWCLENLAFACDWVLFVDADEVVTPALAAELARTLAGQPGHAGYFIPGRFEFLGRQLRFGHRNLKLSLVDRRRTRFPPCDDLGIDTMWEVEGHYQPIVDGSTGRLTAHLWHADRKPLFAWFDRHNRYSDWEAQLDAAGEMARLRSHESRTRRLAKTLHRTLPLRPAIIFLHSYVWRLGLLDGAAGLHFALARAFYAWQVDVKRHALKRIAGR